jgi:hypothetical protein
MTRVPAFGRAFSVVSIESPTAAEIFMAWAGADTPTSATTSARAREAMRARVCFNKFILSVLPGCKNDAARRDAGQFGQPPNRCSAIHLAIGGWVIIITIATSRAMRRSCASWALFSLLAR